MKYVSIKSVQAYLQKCNIWPKKFEKGRHEWNKACVKTGIKLNILVDFLLFILCELFTIFELLNLIG